jgi:hypothetical protein
LNLRAAIAAADVVALQGFGELIRRSAIAEVGHGLVDLPTAGVGALRLMDQHCVTGVDTPHAVGVGDVDGISTGAATVNHAHTDTVDVIQIAIRWHHAVAAIAEHIVG